MMVPQLLGLDVWHELLPDGDQAGYRPLMHIKLI